MKNRPYDYIKPTHYGSKSGPDVISILEDFSVNDPLIWNACKYLLRLGKKPDNAVLQEVKKAKEYLKRKIKFLKKAEKKKKKRKKRL